MIDGGSPVSALAAQVSMLNEVLRAFAATDFSSPANGSTEGATPVAEPPPAGSPSAGPPVSAGALPAGRAGGASDLPPADPGRASSADAFEPARSLAGLRPPAATAAPSPRAAEPDAAASRGGRAAFAPEISVAPANRQAPENIDRAAAVPAADAADGTATPAAADRTPGARRVAPAEDGSRPVASVEAPEPGSSPAVDFEPRPGGVETASLPGGGGSATLPGATATAAFDAIPLDTSAAAERGAARMPAEAGTPEAALAPSIPRALIEQSPLKPPNRSDETARPPSPVSVGDASRHDLPSSDLREAGPLEAAVHPSTEALPVIRHDAVADIDLRFFSDSASGPALGGGALGDAGPAAMLVFNAAMTPGWPPPRPFDMPDAEEILNRLTGSPLLAGREGDVEGRLGLAALAGGAMARLRRLPRARRLRALLGLAALMDTIGAVIEAVEGELLAASQARRDEDDWAEAGVRRRMTA